jgi:hypothetical protein
MCTELMHQFFEVPIGKCGRRAVGDEMRLYVSTEGNDDWSGSLACPNDSRSDGPFATLGRARDEVRKLKTASPSANFLVFIRGGVYHLDETVVFGLEDSAPEGRTTTYAAYPGEAPVFSSGVRISGWEELGREVPAALQDFAKDKVWVADMPEGVDRFHTLYEEDRRLERSRTQGFIPIPIAKKAKGDESLDPHFSYGFPEGAIKDWDNLEDVELVVRPIQWTMQILPLESVDEGRSIATTSVSSVYPIEPFRGNHGNLAWIENVLEGLDAPGTWAVDTTSRKVYLWPTGARPAKEIYAPTLTELIRVEGEVDFLGPKDVPVRGIVFRGLTFTQADRGRVTDDDVSIQHDWEMLDKADALLRFRGAEDCAVEQCRFHNSGGSAIRLDLHCQKMRVSENLVANLGGGGIHLIGYGPGTKDVNKHNEISNNLIHHCGRLYWHSHGIVLWQSGENRVAHNTIHHMPRKSICLAGVRPHFFLESKRPENWGLRECAPTIRWHEISDERKIEREAENVMRQHDPAIHEYMDWPEITALLHTRNNIVEDNEVYRTNQLLADGASINVSGAGEGNIIRRNYMHDIYNPNIHGALRSDDYQKGTLVEGNVVFKTNTDGLCIRHENFFVNNVVCDVGFRTDPGAKVHCYQWIGHSALNGSRIERNIYFNPGDGQEFYGRGYGPDIWEHLGKMKGGTIDLNVYFNTESPDAPAVIDKMRLLGHDKSSIYEDPMFVDWENGDFRLGPESPALKLGIQSVDVREAGITSDFPERFRA